VPDYFFTVAREIGGGGGDTSSYETYADRLHLATAKLPQLAYQHSKVFYRPKCPSCHPTTSVKALKATWKKTWKNLDEFINYWL